MTWNADTAYAGDHAFVDGVETVSYQVRDLDQTIDSSDASVEGKRGDLSKSQIQALSGLGILPTDVSWRLWGGTMGTIVPVAGDTITDSSGVVYTVLGAVKKRWGPTWLCACRQQEA